MPQPRSQMHIFCKSEVRLSGEDGRTDNILDPLRKIQSKRKAKEHKQSVNLRTSHSCAHLGTVERNTENTTVMTPF